MIQWESGWNPNAVGDPPSTRAALDAIFEAGGLEAVKATGHSFGLGQINTVNLGPGLGYPDVYTPALNAKWAADYLARHYLALGQDERLAVAAYRGPSLTYNGRDWHWDEPRNSGIIAFADQADREGLGGAPSGPVPTVPPASGAGALVIEIPRFNVRLK